MLHTKYNIGSLYKASLNQNSTFVKIIVNKDHLVPYIPQTKTSDYAFQNSPLISGKSIFRSS